MDILVYSLLLLAGLFVLIFGANLLISGATTLAFKFRIPPIVVGLTVVALGTSLPEMAINIVASLEEASGITLGNIVGSNITNILLITGLASMIRPLKVSRTVVKKEIPLSLLGTLILIAMTLDPVLDGKSKPILERSEGLVLLITFIGYVYFLAAFLQRQRLETTYSTSRWPILRSIGGIVGLIVGSRMVVYASILLAESAGISQAFIGLFMIAIGTSLPEMVTSVVAAYKGHHDIAVGNVAGSNLFNITLVLGLSSIISPIEVHPLIYRDLVFLLLSNALFVIFYFLGRGYIISRWEGSTFVLLYLLYFLYSLRIELAP